MVSRKELACCRGFSSCQTLQSLAEGFLRFVMFETVALIKLMGAVAHNVRPDRHTSATMFARPILGDGQQFCSCAEAALAFSHHQSVNFRSKLLFQKGL